MINFLPDPVFALLISVLLGAVLGIRQEMDAQERGSDKNFLGVRTMMTLTIMGTISTMFPDFSYLPVVFFVGISLIVTVAYSYGAFKMNRIGMTSEFTSILTFWIGVLVGYHNFLIAILLTIFLAILKEFRDDLHRFVHTLTIQENRGMIQLLALSGAVLPFLPKEAIDPWGVFVPFNAWLLVILISGLEFAGYFLTKYFGAKGGVPVTAFLGALVSSTAVTVALAEKSKRVKRTGILAVGIILAVGVMELRAFLEIFLLRSSEFRTSFLMVPLFMGISGIILAIFSFRKFNQDKQEAVDVDKEVKVSSPFEIVSAVKFGLIFVVVLFAITFGKKYLGEIGVYGAAFLSGLVDVDAVVLSSMEALRQGELPVKTVETVIFIALAVNAIVKIAYVYLLGSKELTKRISVGVLVITLIGLATFLFI